MFTAVISSTACAVLRMGCLITVFPGYSEDFTQFFGFMLTYQSLETPIGLICICVPALGPLWNKLKASRLGICSKRMLRILSRSRRGSRDSDPYTTETKLQNGEVYSGKQFVGLDGVGNTSIN